MAINKKVTGRNIGSLASNVLTNPNSSAIQKSLAGAALSQRKASRQTGIAMETKASRVLSSNKYNNTTKKLAASVLSQSNKKR